MVAAPFLLQALSPPIRPQDACLLVSLFTLSSVVGLA